jgi:oxygen-independent coproporphyrinogen-3 oxidase
VSPTPPSPPASTTAGNYFVSNYPPFSYWSEEQRREVEAALDTSHDGNAKLGLYHHIPFCRKRCHFCYFRVYTDRNAREIQDYLEATVAELRSIAARPLIRGRRPHFVYFGGGTPSYLSARQLEELARRLQEILPWDAAEEVAFECEPGTLNPGKLSAIRGIGVTRLSLGVENFDDHVLEINGRAHRSGEVYGAFERARAEGFPQINIDLIAGMVEETEENWRRNIERTIALQPDSVTIYQMEVPYNTTIYRDMKASGRLVAPVADWDTKRRWVKDAFAALEASGYTVVSGYTAVRDPARTRFVYRDALWSGADLIGLGVASFSHAAGVHFQNLTEMEPYLSAVRGGALPVKRAFRTSAEERMIREFILQMKLGRVDLDYFTGKFGADLRARFARQFECLAADGLLNLQEAGVSLTRDGLLRVDSLLHDFFLPHHQSSRLV